MTPLSGYGPLRLQSISGTGQACSVASNLSDSFSQIRDGITALRENLAELVATARQAQVQIGNTARQAASGIARLRAPQTLLIKSDRAGGGIAGPMQLWRDQLRQRSIGEELADWQSKLASTKSGSQAELQAAQRIYGFLKQLARETAQARKVDVDDEKRSTDIEYRRRLQLAQTQRKLGELSTAQAIVREQQLLRQKWALDQQFTAPKGMTSADRPVQKQVDPEEAASYWGYIAQQTESFRVEAEQLGKSWENVFKPIADQLAIFSTNVIMRAQSITRALHEMLRSVMKDFLGASFNSFFTSLFDTSGRESTVADGGLGMVGGLLGDAFKGFLGGIGKSAWSGIGSMLGIGESAAEGGVLSSLLWHGIATGIGNTATDFSSAVGGAAFGGPLLGKLASALPTAAGGWVVPHFAQGGIVSLLHQNEMVLPAHLSAGLQAAIAGGTLGGGHTININAVDAGSVARLFRNNGAALIAALNNAMRNGSVWSPAT